MAERQRTESTKRRSRRSKTRGSGSHETLPYRLVVGIGEAAGDATTAAPQKNDGTASTAYEPAVPKNYSPVVAVTAAGSVTAIAAALLGGRKVIGSSVETELEVHEMLRRGLPRSALSTLVENLHVIDVGEASEARLASVFGPCSVTSTRRLSP